MMRTYPLKPLAWLAFLTGLLSACTNNPNQVPFPEHETEFARPVSRPFKLGEPKPFEWAAPDSIHRKTITTTTLDLDKIPSKPFLTNGFRPFSKPMGETKLDWDSLPESEFDFDKLPTEKLKYKISRLGRPTMMKAPDPETIKEAESAILNLKVEQGDNNVSAMIEDRNGVMWIGMRGKGLCRFDGENYFMYKEEQGLSSLMISKLCIDARGQIWIGTQEKGVMVLDLKAGVIKHLGVSEGLGNNVIFGLMSDRQGQVWVGSWGGGVNIINEEAGTIKHLKDTPALSDNLVRSFLQENDGKVWVGTGSGADIIDRKAGKIKHLSQKAGLSNNNIEYLFQNAENEIWIGTREKVSILNREKNTLQLLGKEQGLSNENIRSIFKDGNGRIWIGNFWDQVDVVNPDVNLIRNVSAKDGLSGRYVPCIARRGDGKLWIGTTEGINIVSEGGDIRYVIEDKNNVFNVIWGLMEDSKGQVWIGNEEGFYIVDPSLRSSKFVKLNSAVYSFMEDGLGRIWIGTDLTGFYIFDPETSSLKHISTSNKSPYFVYSFFKDQHNIWVGCRVDSTSYISVFNEKNLSEKTLVKGPDLRPQTRNNYNVIGRINKGPDGQLWMTAFRFGVILIDPKSNRYRQLDDKSGLKGNHLHAIAHDEFQRTWIGTDYGVEVIDSKQATITTISANEGLIGGKVIDIKMGEKDIKILTTSGLTTLIPDPRREGSFDGLKLKSRKNRREGMGFADIFGSIQRKNKEYWWGVGSYIAIVPPKKESTLPLRAEVTGMYVIGQPAFFIDNNRLRESFERVDSLWDNKSGKFIEKGLHSNSMSYAIRWDSIEGPYNLPVNLRLPYDQNYLTFHFASTEYGDFDKTVYRYILEGQDKQWSKISENTASENYINLDPGTYTFKVRSKGYSQVWSEPAELHFTILPPWWQTRWAYSLYLLFFVASLWAFSKYRSRNLQRQNKQLEEKVRERTKALNESLAELKSTQSQLIHKEKLASLGELTAGIAHEIQNPLNFVNNYSEVNVELIEELGEELRSGDLNEAQAILADLSDNERKIHHHGRRADAIVRGMLEHARATPGEKVPTDLNALADEYLRLAYHGLRAKDSAFQCELITDFDPNLGRVAVAPSELGRVLLNLFNNAFYAVQQRQLVAADQAYTPMVWMSTHRLDEKVVMEVRDNGTGIPEEVKAKIFQPFFTTKPTGEGTGLGLSLSYDIITKGHSGALRVESVPGEGTEFTVELPVG